MRFLNWCKRIYDYEFNIKPQDNRPNLWYLCVGCAYRHFLSYWLVVTKTLDHYFGFEGYMRLRIHNIIIDTNKKSSISVTFVLQTLGCLVRVILIT